MAAHVADDIDEDAPFGEAPLPVAAFEIAVVYELGEPVGEQQPVAPGHDRVGPAGHVDG